MRALEDLVVNERVMYERDNRKDQVMTVFKVALANLVMWTRDRYFPESFAHAIWQRLAPFFHLPGLVVQGQNTVCVELRPFTAFFRKIEPVVLLPGLLEADSHNGETSRAHLGS